MIVSSSDSISLNKAEILTQLHEFSRVINQTGRSATIEFVDGQLKRTDGLSGKELDIEATLLRISHEHEQKNVEN